jgi:hypothetical protein
MINSDSNTVEIYTTGENGLYSEADTCPEFTYTFDDCKISIDLRLVWEG